MKFKQILPILIFATFLFLISCEKEIEFKGDEIKPLLVVNGLVIQGDTVSVKLSRSRSKLKDDFYYQIVTNAKVDLYVNDVFAETLTPIEEMVFGLETPIALGRYISSVVAEAGKSYRLEILADGFSPVSCVTTVPDPIEILAWDTTVNRDNNGGGYSTKNEFSIEFDDNGQQHNYYQLQFKAIEGHELVGNLPDGTTIYSDTVMVWPQMNEWPYILNAQLNDAINEADEFISGTPDNRFAIFKDDSFSGKEMKLRFQIGRNSYYYGSVNNGNENSGNFKLRDIYLYSLSKEYYEYLNTLNLHFWFDDDFFSEPVQVFSNINGGVGIWGSATYSSFSVLDGNYPLDDKVYVDNDGSYGYYY